MRLLERKNASAGKDVVEEVKARIAEYSVHDVREAVATTAEFSRKSSKRKGLPLHCALDNPGTPLELVNLLLQYDEEKRSVIEKDENGWLPVHYACFCNARVEIIQLLLKHTGSMEKCGFNGCLPCDKNHKNVVHLLFGHYGNANEQRWENKSKFGSAIDLAVYCDTPVTTIQCLIRTNFVERLESEQWKDTIASLIESMALVENTSEKMLSNQAYCPKATMTKYQTMEVSSLLELAVWKSNCLNPLQYDKAELLSSMEEIAKLYVLNS